MPPKDVQKRCHDANTQQSKNNIDFPVADGKAVDAGMFAAHDNDDEQRHEQVEEDPIPVLIRRNAVISVKYQQ
mgnify:CR=1 FL=1